MKTKIAIVSALILLVVGLVALTTAVSSADPPLGPNLRTVQGTNVVSNTKILNFVAGCTLLPNGSEADVSCTGGPGGGVTILSCGTGTTCSPSPIVSTGTISADSAVLAFLGGTQTFTGSKHLAVGADLILDGVEGYLRLIKSTRPTSHTPGQTGPAVVYSAGDGWSSDGTANGAPGGPSSTIGAFGGDGSPGHSAGKGGSGQCAGGTAGLANGGTPADGGDFIGRGGSPSTDVIGGQPGRAVLGTDPSNTRKVCIASNAADCFGNGNIPTEAGSDLTNGWFRVAGAFRLNLLSTGTLATLYTDTDGSVKGVVNGAAGTVLTSRGSSLSPVYSTTYTTIDNAGTPLAQRPILNFATGLTASDNGGATRTDVIADNTVLAFLAGAQTITGVKTLSTSFQFTPADSHLNNYGNAAAANTAGGIIVYSGSNGGASNGAANGGAGGDTGLIAGAGGAGAGGRAAGNGGQVGIVGGLGGAPNSGSPGNGGDVFINAGDPFFGGGGSPGFLKIATSTASGIYIGSRDDGFGNGGTPIFLGSASPAGPVSIGGTFTIAPMTTEGVIYNSTSGLVSSLAMSSTVGDCLKSNGTGNAPAWGSCGTGGGTDATSIRTIPVDSLASLTALDTLCAVDIGGGTLHFQSCASNVDLPGTAGHILVDSGTRWVSKAMSGDATIASSGAIALATVASTKGGTGIDTSGCTGIPMINGGTWTCSGAYFRMQQLHSGTTAGTVNLTFSAPSGTTSSTKSFKFSISARVAQASVGGGTIAFTCGIGGSGSSTLIQSQASATQAAGTWFGETVAQLGTDCTTIGDFKQCFVDGGSTITCTTVLAGTVTTEEVLSIVVTGAST